MKGRVVFWALAAVAMVAAAVQASSGHALDDEARAAIGGALQFAAERGLPASPSLPSFAWTMWLAVPALAGVGEDGLRWWSSASGMLCHVATVALLVGTAWRASGGRTFVPIAALAVAASPAAAALAAGNGAIAASALLQTVLLRGCLQLRCAREAWRLGFVAVLAVMMRSEAGLAAAVVAVVVLHDAVRRRAPALLTGYALPFLCVLVPYLAWQRVTNGVWLPGATWAALPFGPVAPSLLAAPPIVWFCARRPDLLAAVSVFLGRRPWFVLAAHAGVAVALVARHGDAAGVWPFAPGLLLALDFMCLRWRAAWLAPSLAVVAIAAFAIAGS
jgi:hypothetical protein